MSQELNIAGKRYGSLTAIERDYQKGSKDLPYWIFSCDCGAIRSMQKSAVITGRTKSCGCVHPDISSRMIEETSKDVIGKKFGRLIVIGFAYVKQGNSYWNCQCDCGGCCIMPIHSLKDGNTTSCGCFRIYRRDRGESGLKRLYNNYKVQAKRNHKNPDQKEYTTYRYNGLDRVDSKGNYEKENVVPCCKWCNIAKRERTVEEFEDHVIRIFQHLNLGLSNANVC